MNEEIKYIPYGLDEISQLDLMTSLADGIEPYLNSKRWARKEKNRKAWLSAYLDIINLGLVGASNESGVWRVNHSGNIDMDSKSDLEKEMYGDAAYYIRQQMSKMTPRAKEEDKKEEKKDKYNFINDFLNHLLTKYYGNNKELYLSPTEGWDSQDERDPKTGLRTSITNRKTALINALTSYKELLEDKYDFEGSSFSGKDDVVRKIDEAIEALNSPDLKDDNEKLHALGLGYNQFFSNGGNDIYGTLDGKLITYSDYYKLLLELKLLLEKLNLEKLKIAKKAAYDNTLFLNTTNSKMIGQSPTALKNKYKDSNSLINALMGYSQRDIHSLTPDELSEVHGAYKYLAKEPIDNKLLKQLQSSSSRIYAGAAPNRFRKIKGIDNLVWDDKYKRVIFINTRKLLQAFLNLPTDLFNEVKTLLDKENEYFRNANDGFTDADKRELGAIALDLTAMFDPTRIYGTVAGIGASGLRTYNRWNDADGFTLTDAGASILDLGLNGVQWLPGVGNVANGAKGILSLAKFAPRIGRLIARGGAAGGLIYGIHGLPEVWNKIDFAHPIDSAKRLTVEDWRKLSALIAGIKGTRDLNVTNRATRRILEQNDVQVSNRWSDKAGLTRTKIESEVTTPTVKMKVGDKEVSIPINEKIKQNLDKKLSKKGNNSEERSKVAREDIELLKAAEKAGIKVKDENGKITKEWEEAVVTYNPSWRDKTIHGVQIPVLRRNSGTFGTSTSSASNVGNPLKFLEYLDERGLLDKVWYGSNTTLRRINNNLLKNGIYGTGKTEQLSETPKDTETPEKSIAELRKSVKSYLEGTAKHSGNNLSEEPFKAGDFNFEVNKFPNSSAGNIDISFNGKVMKSISFNNLKDMMKKVAKFLKENRRLSDTSGTFIKRINTKEMGEILKQLKLKGVFKQGGIIDKQKVQRYKEFIRK